MRIVKTVKPGQKGTGELLSRLGANLLRVRYRYDEDTCESLKTVELVVQRRSLKPTADCRGSRPVSLNRSGLERRWEEKADESVSVEKLRKWNLQRP